MSRQRFSHTGEQLSNQERREGNSDRGESMQLLVGCSVDSYKFIQYYGKFPFLILCSKLQDNLLQNFILCSKLQESLSTNIGSEKAKIRKI